MARLLDTAKESFNRRGIQSAGMGGIRDASALSFKRLYRLFPSKEQLVVPSVKVAMSSSGPSCRANPPTQNRAPNLPRPTRQRVQPPYRGDRLDALLVEGAIVTAGNFADPAAAVHARTTAPDFVHLVGGGSDSGRRRS